MSSIMRVGCSLFTFALAGLAAVPATAGYAEGLEAYRRGDLRTAHGEFRMAAERGDAGSQYMLGRMYENGQEVIRDLAQAHMWYSLAAAQDYRPAAEARKALGAQMTDEQLARASSMAAGIPVTPSAPSPVAVSALPPGGRVAAVPTLGADAPVASVEVRTVQRELRALGYDTGTVDGILGMRTRAAIRAYQADAGLPVNGEISPELLSRLRSGAPRQAAVDAESFLADSGRLDAYVRTAQEQLRDHGYYGAPPSGQVDRELRSAISEYQRDAGLPVTGQVSEALIDHLQFSRPKVLRHRR